MANLEFNAVKAIAAAYDSVALINELNAKENKTQEELDTLSRNKKHIEIMLAKPEFFNALTDAQKTELNIAKS
jgi:hypothetical protein